MNKEFIQLIKYRELLKQLVLKDIKLKYRRSYLGYLWSILNPLLMMIVLTVVFSNLFRFDIPNFSAYLLTGQVIFGFISESTTSSVGAIIYNAALIKKTYVPKYIFVLSKVSSSLINMLFSMVALVLVMFFTSVPITWNVLWLPMIFLELYIFSLGLSFFLAAFSVFFRDVQYLWGVMTSIWMYLTPIIYPVSIISDEYRWWYDNLNPLVNYVEQFRTVILNNSLLSVDSLYQGFIIAFITLFIGVIFFNKKQNEFILYI